jgi:hypothetical protein
MEVINYHLSPLTSLPYKEVHISNILTLASFLLLVNLSYAICARVVSAGLLGPLLVGAAYSASLSSILPGYVQYTIQALGYLGLMLLVVEGGMGTRLDILSDRRTLVLALLVGSTGIILPIALSLALLPFAYGYGYIESFTVGASLPSTSLGTIFSVISNVQMGLGLPAKKSNDTAPITEEADYMPLTSENIIDTRIGTILVAAALLDDIVGLVIQCGHEPTTSFWSAFHQTLDHRAARRLICSPSRRYHSDFSLLSQPMQQMLW